MAVYDSVDEGSQKLALISKFELIPDLGSNCFVICLFLNDGGSRPSVKAVEPASCVRVRALTSLLVQLEGHGSLQFSFKRNISLLIISMSTVSYAKI